MKPNASGWRKTAADVRLKAGEWLVRSGETPWFYVLYEGRLRIVADIHGIQTEFPEYDFTEGDFLGEVPLLLRTPVFNSARAQTPCRIARLDKQQFFQLIRDSKEAHAMILEVLGERLLRIQERSLSLMTSRVLIFGRNKDADCHEVRAFLSANRIPYEWVDRDRHPKRVPPGVSEDPDCPAVVVDGQFFAEAPTTREVAEALQLQTKPNSDSYDVVIVGAGPAGTLQLGLRLSGLRQARTDSRRRPMWSARKSSLLEAAIQRGKLPCFYRAMRMK
jgi:thioredoxin reductase (NADPH)